MRKIVITGDVIQTVETNHLKPRGGFKTSPAKIEQSIARIDNYYTLIKSLHTGRDIINTNIRQDNKHLVTWLTLTYRVNMQNTEKLYVDWKHFLSRYLRKKGDCEYIIACEPQARGAWHIHALVIWKDYMPYLPFDEVLRAWGKGSVYLKTLVNRNTGTNDAVENVGVYLSTYLTSDGVKKHDRLKLYPRGFHPFRWSRGTAKPTILYDDGNTLEFDKLWVQIKEKYAPAKTYSIQKTYDIQSLTEPLKIQYEYYNINRLKSQAR